MAVQFLIGRSGSGKTTYILDQIVSELQQEPVGRPIIWLVPEQGSFQAEHALVNTGSLQGSIRAQVLSFRRLAYRVLQETGGSARIAINEEGKKMLLYKILKRRKSELKLFGDSADQLGFVGKLNELYTEMKRYCVDASCADDQLEQLVMSGYGTPILKDKLHDIALIYHDLENELSPLYIDDEDNLMALTKQVVQSDYIRDAEIWVDGFHGFTPQEFLVLEQLMLHARDVRIALTLDKPVADGSEPHELDLFHPTASTYMKLKGIATEAGVSISDYCLPATDLPRFKKSPVLAHLERGYDRRIRWQDDPFDSDDSIQAQQVIAIRTASSRQAEVEGVIREMRRLAMEEGIRYREMALFVRNLGDYESFIGSLFEDAGIPCFIDQKRSELHHPLVEFVRSAFDVVQRFWRYEDVFRCVKTDLMLPMDGSVSREHMDQLENYVLASGLQGSRWTDNRPWKGAPSLSLEEGEPASRPEKDPSMAILEQCRKVIVGPLHTFEKRLKKAKTARDMAAAVYLLLEQVEAPQKLDRLSQLALLEGRLESSKEHRQLWGAVIDLLDQLVEMMGNEKLSIEMFAGILETGLGEMKMALVPPALDQVLVGNMDRTRSRGITHSFLLGFNEGVVPAVFKEDGVLTEQERSVLGESGLELAPGISRKLMDERFLIYNVLTSSSKQVWISYPTADEEGKVLLPSDVIRHVKKMFPFLTEQAMPMRVNYNLTVLEQLNYVSNPEQTLSNLIVQLRHWKQGADIPEFWWELYNWYLGHEGWQARLERMLGSLFYSNGVTPLTSATSLRLYGSKIRTSVSRMERFVACPFSHFASHGLKLKERQMYRLKAPDIGQLFHAALSEMAMRLKLENRSWGSMSADECRQEAERTVDRLAPKLQGEILLSTKRYGFISRKLKNIVGRASIILGEHARRGDFEPLGLELDFGPGKTLPPLTFTLRNGIVMEIAGRIDRVDVAEGQGGLLLRVIDYKSSQTDLKLHEVYYGLSLQMLTYLDVLLTSAEEWLGEKALPAGTLYFHVHDPLLQSSNGLTRDKAEEELLKRYKMRGLLVADRDVVAKMDNTLDKGYSSILPVAVKADGSFYSSASVATPEQWDTLISQVRKSIVTIGTRITEGDVKIEPYRIQQETPCTYCAFRPVCQFDENMEGNQYHLLSKPGKDQVWQLLSDEERKDTP